MFNWTSGSARWTLRLELVGHCVVCPECSAACSMKDHAAERSCRNLDAMQLQTILTGRVPRCSCETCRAMTIAVPWAEKHSRFTQAIMTRAVARGLERRFRDKARRVEIDEMSFGRGQEYVTMMMDID